MAALIWRSPWILLLFANIFWAGNIVVGRAVLGSVPALALSFWRWTGAFAVAFCFAWPHLKADWPILRAHWKLLLILAATGIAFFNASAYIGLADTTALNVLIMQSSLPLLVAFWALLLFRDRPTFWQIAAMILSLCGVAVIAVHGSMASLLTFSFHRADVWILASVVIYGLYIALLRRRPEVHALSLMQMLMGIGALMVLPAYAVAAAGGERISPAWTSYAGIAYMAVFPSFISYLFFNRAVTLIGGARAGQTMHLIPLIGSAMAMLFLGEDLRPFHLMGACLIGGGLLLAELTASNRRPVTQTPAENFSPATQE